jgi:HEAT repeat protein
MAAWTAGILLALGLAWFVGAVAVPVWQTRTAVDEVWRWNIYCQDSWPARLQSGIERLGGPERAVSKLRLYLRSPQRVAPYRETALRMLGKCGGDAVPVLLPYLCAKDSHERCVAAEQLGVLKERRTVEALVAALQDSEWSVRAAAADALGEIGDARAEPALETATRDSNWRVCREARRALQKIRGQPVESNAEGIP